ncbi:uncharacterized protein LOC105842282 [Bombyx mori]|uniref:Uncharacterized protein n=1 Tax=Bombyx mori TaxID=7091 RepID=A0A8R2DP50_BOMMO|nr:uncharacterized protein LOC105842282 [Bombyx mori]
MASIEIRKMGWLDRVIEYHKNKFYKDVLQTNPVEIKAQLKPAPPGYKDSSAWDRDSVMRLLLLITESEAAAPVRLALRRVLRPTRRFMMDKHQSYKYFPSLHKQIENDIYYEVETDEDYQGAPDQYNDIPGDDDVIVVSNPVEARLPSAQISVRLLRDILEARAEAGRITPKTTKSTIYWKPMSSSCPGHHSTKPGTSNAQNATTVSESGSASGARETTSAPEATGAAENSTSKDAPTTKSN